MAEDEEVLKEARKLALEDRLAHKNWRVRADANSDICAICDGITNPKDNKLKEFGPYFKTSVADSNASAQEKALDALIAYLKALEPDSGLYAKDVCDALVCKCLTGRAKTAEKAQAALLLWVELGAAEIFLDVMVKAVKCKVAKAVVLAVDVMHKAVNQFGTNVVPPKKILKLLPELFDHQDQNVRAAAKALTIELCRWIGKDAIKSILFEKMRDTIKKEIEVEVDNVRGVSKPTRKIRSEQAKGPTQEAALEVPSVGCVEEAASTTTQKADEFELLDPVDILGLLGKSSFWDGVEAPKWSDRRDAAAELTNLASARRLAPGNYMEVSRVLRKLISDVNLAVSVEAVQAAGNLARGLRKDFSACSKGFLPLLLERFKERKPAMVEAVMQTLRTIYASCCFTLGDVIDEVRVATKSKSPSVRTLCLTWVAHCIGDSSKASILKHYKEYVPILMEALCDSTPEVRDAAFGGVAALVKLIGIKLLEKSLQKLDEVKRKRLTDLIALDSSRAVPTSVTVPSKPLVSSRVRPPVDEIITTVPGSRSPGSLLTSNKTLSETSSNEDSPMKSSSTYDRNRVVKQTEFSFGSESPAESEIPPKKELGDISLEEIELRIGSYFQVGIVSQLRSALAKDRLEGILTLQKEVENRSRLDPFAESLVQYLSVVPGWMEKNVQVQQKMMEILSRVAESSSCFSKRCVVLSLAGVSERIADVRTRVQASKCLTLFCKSVEPAFVVEGLLDVLKDHKNPKIVREGLLWLLGVIEDFGPSHIPVKKMIEFCRDVGLQSTAVMTRNSAIKVIGALHKTCALDLKQKVSDLKPAVVSLGNTCTQHEQSPVGQGFIPKRRPLAPFNGQVGRIHDIEALPREDISGKLTPALLENFTSINWKVRQESIAAVGSILQEANMRIQATGTEELLGALKCRLRDPNKNVVILSLGIIGKLALAIGPAFERSLKVMTSDVVKCLGDNKKMVREAAIKTFDTWLVKIDLRKLIPYLTPVILDASPEGRQNTFEWLSSQVASLENESDVRLLLKPIATAAQDKNFEVRKAAEALLFKMINFCGEDMVSRATKSVQGPELSLLLSLMDHHRVVGASADQKEFSPEKNLKGALPRQVIGKRSPEKRVAVSSEVTSVRFPVTALKQEEAVESLDAAVQGYPLLNLKNCDKEEREKVLSRRSKVGGGQRQDLEIDLVKYFREDVQKRLSSTDFRKQIEGVDILRKAVSANFKGMIEVLDILLRWTVLRVCESNTVCLMKVLDFLQELFLAVRKDGYSLTDSEASTIFPCLVEKAGHNIEKVREKMRDLVRILCCLYPSLKVITYLAEGLRSKNNRKRIECVEHVGFVVAHCGVELRGIGKGLHSVVALLAERDGELRKASLQTLASAYEILGEDVWRYLGKMSDLQRSLLVLKFKQKAQEMERDAGDAQRELRLLPEHGRVGSAEPCGESESTMSNSTSTNQPVTSLTTPTQLVDLVDWKEALVAIETATDPDQVIAGMRVICFEIELASRDVQGAALEGMAASADELLCSLTARVSSTFDTGLCGSSTRACKYTLNTLMQTVQAKRLVCEIKEKTLHALIKELLIWLLDVRLPSLDEGNQLVKALNVLMLKILENADRTSAFVVLIQLLQPSFGTVHSSEPCLAVESVLSSPRFSALVVKCLITLTKVLASTINMMVLGRLLLSIHECFQQLGLQEIRKRAGADDKPLQMVKTVLYELVKLCGPAIKGHLSMIPIDSEPKPIILAYIDLHLQTLATSRILTPTLTGSEVLWLDAGGEGPTAETQLKQELAAIFKKIAHRSTCKIGLYELYRITQLYPQLDIFAQLQNASMAFRTYIRDGLAQMEKATAPRRAGDRVVDIHI